MRALRQGGGAEEASKQPRNRWRAGLHRSKAPICRSPIGGRAERKLQLVDRQTRIGGRVERRWRSWRRGRMEQQQQTQIGWPAARPLLFPLPLISSCALQTCSDWACLRGSIGAISHTQSSLPSPAPCLSLPTRADPSPFPRARCLLFPLRALRGLLRACFFPPRGPALDLGGRLGVHPTPWRRLSAQGDAIRRNGVAGRTPPLGSRLDALASPRRRRENHGKDIHQLLHNILSMIIFLSTL